MVGRPTKHADIQREVRGRRFWHVRVFFFISRRGPFRFFSSVAGSVAPPSVLLHSLKIGGGAGLIHGPRSKRDQRSVTLLTLSAVGNHGHGSSASVVPSC